MALDEMVVDKVLCSGCEIDEPSICFIHRNVHTVFRLGKMQPLFRESGIPEKMQIVFRRCNMQVMINDDHTCFVQKETYHISFRKSNIMCV